MCTKRIHDRVLINTFNQCPPSTLDRHSINLVDRSTSWLAVRRLICDQFIWPLTTSERQSRSFGDPSDTLCDPLLQNLWQEQSERGHGGKWEQLSTPPPMTVTFFPF